MAEITKADLRLRMKLLEEEIAFLQARIAELQARQPVTWYLPGPPPAPGYVPFPPWPGGEFYVPGPYNITV